MQLTKLYLFTITTLAVTLASTTIFSSLAEGAALDSNFGMADPTNSGGSLAFPASSPGTTVANPEFSVDPVTHKIYAGYMLNFSLSSATKCSARYTAAGALDTSYGGGAVCLPYSTSFNQDIPRYFDNAGKLYSNVVAINQGSFVGAIVRQLDNGQKDSSFGKNGVRYINWQNRETRNDATLALIDYINGKPRLVITGWSQTSADVLGKPTVGALNADGTWDTSFGVGGKIFLNIPASANMMGANAYQVILDSDGNYLVSTRYGRNANGPLTSLSKISRSGVQDMAFNGNGILAFQAVDPKWHLNPVTKKILFSDSNPITYNWATGTTDPMSITLTQFNQDGSIDASFGLSGKLLLNLQNSGMAPVNSVTFDPAGNFLVLADTGMMLFQSNGQPANAFGPNGNGKIITSSYMTEFPNCKGAYGPNFVEWMVAEFDSRGGILLGGDTFKYDPSTNICYFTAMGRIKRLVP